MPPSKKDDLLFLVALPFAVFGGLAAVLLVIGQVKAMIEMWLR